MLRKLCGTIHRVPSSWPGCPAARRSRRGEGHRARAPNAKLLDTVAPRTTPRVRLRSWCNSSSDSPSEQKSIGLSDTPWRPRSW